MVNKRFLCPYLLPGDYCNHPEGPAGRCEGDGFPEDCPGEDVEEKDLKK